MLTLPEEIKQKVEELSKLLEAGLARLDEIEAFNTRVKADELRVRTIEDRILVANEKLTQDKKQFNTEKEFADKKRVEVDKKSETNEREWKKIQLAQDLFDKLEKREEEIKAQEEALTTKLATAESIDKKLEDITKREALIEKEKVLARARATILDEQSSANEREKQRLQRIAATYS